MIPVIESGTSSTKQAANWPFAFPAFTRQGVFGTNSRASITSLIAAKNSSRFAGSFSAAETWPTTRRTMSDHSSIGRPLASFNDYRLLITRRALSPKGWSLRLGAGLVVSVFGATRLPKPALIFSHLSRGGFARVIGFQRLFD